MSFEYKVLISEPADVSLKEIGSGLQLSGHYALIKSSSSEIAFAYSDASRRTEWPEDIVICLTDKYLDAAIHSGTKQQRERFVADLSHVLTKQRHRFEIEEQ